MYHGEVVMLNTSKTFMFRSGLRPNRFALNNLSLSRFCWAQKFIKICIAPAEQVLPYGKKEEFSVQRQKYVFSTKWLKCVVSAQRTFNFRFRLWKSPLFTKLSKRKYEPDFTIIIQLINEKNVYSVFFKFIFMLVRWRHFLPLSFLVHCCCSSFF